MPGVEMGALRRIVMVMMMLLLVVDGWGWFRWMVAFLIVVMLTCLACLSGG